MAGRPLFIPLKAKFFDDFERGNKDTEFRPYGARWNERTCAIGRPVVLSRGYGKQRRLRGIVAGFEVSETPTRTDAWRECYGTDLSAPAACIRISGLVPVKT